MTSWATRAAPTKHRPALPCSHESARTFAREPGAARRTGSLVVQPLPPPAGGRGQGPRG